MTQLPYLSCLKDFYNACLDNLSFNLLKHFFSFWFINKVTTISYHHWNLLGESEKYVSFWMGCLHSKLKNTILTTEWKSKSWDGQKTWTIESVIKPLIIELTPPQVRPSWCRHPSSWRWPSRWRDTWPFIIQLITIR